MVSEPSRHFRPAIRRAMRSTTNPRPGLPLPRRLALTISTRIGSKASESRLRDSDLVVFDLDNCIGPTGILHSLARRIVDQAQSYTEITPSNRGLRIIGTGTGPRVHRQFKSIDGEFGCECYRQAARFITVTGRVFEDAPQVLANLDAVMDQVVAELDALKNQASEN